MPNRRDILLAAVGAGAAVAAKAQQPIAEQNTVLPALARQTPSYQAVHSLEELDKLPKPQELTAKLTTPANFTENEWRLLVGAYLGSTSLVQTALTNIKNPLTVRLAPQNAIDFDKQIADNFTLGEAIAYLANEQIANQVIEQVFTTPASSATLAKLAGRMTTAAAVREQVTQNTPASAATIKTQVNSITDTMRPLNAILPPYSYYNITPKTDGNYSVSSYTLDASTVALARMGLYGDDTINANVFSPFDRGEKSLRQTAQQCTTFLANADLLKSLVPATPTLGVIGR